MVDYLKIEKKKARSKQANNLKKKEKSHIQIMDLLFGDYVITWVKSFKQCYFEILQDIIFKVEFNGALYMLNTLIKYNYCPC
jgi:hypothetical protein